MVFCWEHTDNWATVPPPIKKGYGSAFAEPKKDLHQDQQVHYQEDAVDPDLTGPGFLGPDVVQVVTIFALSKFTFNRDPLTIFLVALLLQPFQLLTILLGDFFGATQWFSCKTNLVFAEIFSILPITIDRISQYCLRIVSVTFTVDLYLCL